MSRVTLRTVVLLGALGLWLPAAPAAGQAAAGSRADGGDQAGQVTQVLTQEQAEKLRAEGDRAYDRYDFVKALEIYARVHPYFTRDFVLNQRLGWLYMNRSQPDYTKAAEHYRAAYRANPNNIDVLHDLAQVLGWQRQFDEALPLYRQLLEKTNRADYILEFARVLVWAGKDEEAVEHYQSYLNRNPSDFRARNEFGRVLGRRRDFSGASAQFNYVLRFQPENAEARLGLAQVMSWSGQYQSSLSETERILAENPKDFPARLVKAYDLLGLGRTEEARALFQELEKEDPRNADVREGLRILAQRPARPEERPAAPAPAPAVATTDFLRGQEAEAAGRFSEAATHYRAHLAEHPDDDAARFLLARVLGWDKQYDESEKILRDLLAKNPDDINANLQLARVLNWSGHYDESAASFRKALELDPDDTEARVELARVLALARRYDESVPEYRRVLAARPDHKEARIGLAQTLLWASQLDEAGQELAELQRRYPGDPQVAVLERTRETMQGQRAAAREISPGASEEYFRALVEREPANATYRLELADALLRREDHKGALEQLNEAARLRPEDDAIRLKLARVYSWNRQYPESAKHYRDWLSRHDDLEVRTELARVLSWGTMYAESIAEYRRVLEREPNRTAVRLELARVLSWARRYDESVTEFNAVLRSDPDNVEAWVGKGRVHAYQSKWQPSLFAYENALRLDPHNAEARTGKAQTMLWAGRIGPARNLLQELHAQNPDDTTVMVALASAEDSSGRPKEALELLDRAATLEPRNPEVQIMRDRIRSRQRPELRLRWGWARDTERLNTWGHQADFRFSLHPRLRNFVTVDFLPSSGPANFFGYGVGTAGGLRFAPHVPVNPFVPAPTLLSEGDFPAGMLLLPSDRVRQSAVQVMFGAQMQMNTWFRWTAAIGTVTLRHGNLAGDASGFPSSRTRLVGMIAPTFRAGRWEFTPGYSRQYAPWTPKAISQTTHYDEGSLNVVYRPDDRTRFALYLWHRRLGPEFEIPDIGTFEGRIFRQRGTGGTFDATRVLWRGERGEFEAGYTGTMLGYTHPFGIPAVDGVPTQEFFVNPGFFTPNFYQRHAGLVRALYRPTNWWAWDVHGTLGPQQILHGSDLSFSATGGTRMEFTLNPRTTLTLGYDYFSTAGAGQVFTPTARTGAYHVNSVYVMLHIRF